ncbi:hypothetical protein DVH24_012681, partial [Malus domestica]
IRKLSNVELKPCYKSNTPPVEVKINKNSPYPLCHPHTIPFPSPSAPLHIRSHPHSPDPQIPLHLYTSILLQIPFVFPTPIPHPERLAVTPTCCDTCDDRGLSVEERVAVLPSEDEGLVGFLELNGVKRVGVEDGADDVEFLDDEGVKKVGGRGVGIGGLDWMRFFEEYQAEFVMQSRRFETYGRGVREVGPSEEKD